MIAWLHRVVVSLDILLNVLLGGEQGQTVSMRAALSERRGETGGCVVCAILSFLVEKDHCSRTDLGLDTVGGAAVVAALLVLCPFLSVLAVAALIGKVWL